MLSIIIPSRNEKYLQKTINDVLHKSTGKIEVIAVLDGYWPATEEIVTDDRVNYIHFSASKGMRAAINAGVALAKGDTILKTDAHCMFKRGFDETVVRDCTDSMVLVPSRYALDPEAWTLINNPKYPIHYMYLSSDFHGVPWEEKNRDKALENNMIDDIMSSQGSCWVMKRKYYDELELLDQQSYGTFYNEFQEIGLKCWLSGGRVVVDKYTWYAHWHKPREVGRGYSLEKGLQEQAEAFTKRWMTEGWHKQNLPISWLIKKFAPVPTWNDSWM